MPAINLSFRSRKELENFIVSVATPIADRVARKHIDSAKREIGAFRKKRDTATPQSSIQVQNITPYTPR